MCLIIANPECKPIPDEHIINAFSTNSHGFGIMCSSAKRLFMFKGMHGLEQIKYLFAKVTASGVPYVAHFRMATHGLRNKDNCHPFEVDPVAFGGIGMVHNGTLSGSEWRAPTKSDTALLVDRIRDHVEGGDFNHSDLFEKQAPVVMDRYRSSIGGDKLVFMGGDGRINIVNEQNGHWINGVWYSNTYSIASYSDWGSWGDDEDWATKYMLR